MNSPAPDILWPAERPASLGPRDVQVWAFALNVAPEMLQRCHEILSPDERKRSGRFRFDQHRNRYIAGRGLLRALLAHSCSCAPSRLNFTYSQRGKPSLAAEPTLHFNLSHSGDLALVALTRIGLIGVDVEPVRVLNDAEDLVKRFFSARESSLFHGLPESDRAEAFFNLWTRKEAWLKATGDGISGGLSQVEVAFLKNEPVQIHSIAGSPGAAKSWTLQSCVPASGWIGAVAVRGTDPEFHCFRLNEHDVLKVLQ